MAQADSVHSTPPTNTSANNVKSQEKALARQAAQRQRALKRLRKLRARAADEINRLLEFIDAVDDTDVDSQCDDDPLDDADAEDSLGFLEHHPTTWSGNGRDRSGNQERLRAGSAGDFEDEHDDREPGEDDEPSLAMMSNRWKRTPATTSHRLGGPRHSHRASVTRGRRPNSRYRRWSSQRPLARATVRSLCCQQGWPPR
jgi:hypothetical protein